MHQSVPTPLFPRFRWSMVVFGVVAFLLSGLCPLGAQSPDTSSPLRSLVERYSQDREALFRRYAVPFSPDRQDRMGKFYSQWQSDLEGMDFDALGVEGRIDFLLLKKEVGYQLELLRREEMLFQEMVPLIPFALDIMELEESRRRFHGVNPEEVAALLAKLPGQVAEAREAIRAREGTGGDGVSRIVALRAEGLLRQLNRVLSRWYEYSAGYDPIFT